MTGLESLLQQYGWVGFTVYFLARDVFPWLRDRVYPQRVKEQEEERKRLNALEERAVRNEERHVEALETMSKSVTGMALAITTNNERLSQVITNQLEHSRFTQDAIIDMRKSVGVKHSPRKESKK
jgi:hypothetical protein